jgi:tetratricopeptide (TPR) repeat protein
MGLGGVLLIAMLMVSGCGGGRSAEDMDRSMREFQLANTLREEGNIPGALTRLQRALELDPENARAHLLLGYIHLGREDYPRAESALLQALQLLEEQQLAGPLAEARNLYGVLKIHQEKYDEAIALLMESATDMLNTAPWYAYGNLGWAYYEKQEYEQAVEALEHAVSNQPRFCLGYYLMGKTYFAMERFEEADSALTDALAADERCGDTFQEAFRLRGETRARLGQRDDAILDLERCVELGPRTEAGRACQRLLEGANSGTE